MQIAMYMISNFSAFIPMSNVIQCVIHFVKKMHWSHLVYWQIDRQIYFQVHVMKMCPMDVEVNPFHSIT